MGNQLSGHVLEHFRRVLHEERARQEEMVENINEASLNQSMTESVGELSSYDQHTADAGAEMQAREFDLGLRTTSETIVVRVNEALDRIDRGAFGICVDCGTSISVERLEALPYAERCLACSETLDQRGKIGDAPSQDLTFARSFTDGTDNVGYDGEDTWQDLARFGTANSPQDDGHFDMDDL